MNGGACGKRSRWRSGDMAKKLPTTVPVQFDAPHAHGQLSPSNAFRR
jgi:hypothetical protein